MTRRKRNACSLVDFGSIRRPKSKWDRFRVDRPIRSSPYSAAQRPGTAPGPRMSDGEPILRLAASEFYAEVRYTIGDRLASPQFLW